MVWMLGDRHNVRRQQFANAGWTTGYSKQCSLTEKQRVNLRQRLSSEQPLLLYIVNFGGMGNTTDVSNLMVSMITEQLNLSGLILLEAPESSNAWEMPHGKLTESDAWQPADTRWCGLTAEQKTAKGEIVPATKARTQLQNAPHMYARTFPLRIVANASVVHAGKHTPRRKHHNNSRTVMQFPQHTSANLCSKDTLDMLG